MLQSDFDSTIGQLDRMLSILVGMGRKYKENIVMRVNYQGILDEPNAQTLKHHAEDMIAAGEKILRDLGNVVGTPQPEKK